MSLYSFGGDYLTGAPYGTPTDTSECCFPLLCRERELPKSQVSFSLSDRECIKVGSSLAFLLLSLSIFSGNYSFIYFFHFSMDLELFFSIFTLHTHTHTYPFMV